MIPRTSTHLGKVWIVAQDQRWELVFAVRDRADPSYDAELRDQFTKAGYTGHVIDDKTACDLQTSAVRPVCRV